MGTLALIGLGSNLGDRETRLDTAVAALAKTPGVQVRAVSSYRETAPVGGPAGQGPFLNAAVRLETALDPGALLAELRRIEQDAGRLRTVRWGERTLDLDLLIFGSLVLDTPELALPHPRFALRRFVLAPLVEIAPEIVDPVTGRTIADLLANLDRRPSILVLTRGTPLRDEVFQGAVAGLSAREIRQTDRPADPWSPERIGDRWVVADFRVDSPTFVVLLDETSGLTPPARAAPVPVLRPSETDPTAIIAEVLATCAATREK